MYTEALVAAGILAIWPIVGVIMQIVLYVRPYGLLNFNWRNKNEWLHILSAMKLGPIMYIEYRARRKRLEFICDLIQEMLDKQEQENANNNNEENDGDSTDS